jgi:copper chaperone CopZ
MNTQSNEKETFVFKTNINCNGCVAKVTPILDTTDGIETWTVDITNKDKILSAISNGISKREIIEIVQKVGFKIETFD